MTAKDFDLILLESFIHETKQTYFNEKRESFKCIPTEYFNGLLNSFKRLNDKVNKIDYTNVILTTPDGEEQQYDLRNDSLSEQIFYLNTKGKVSFPEKQTLNIGELTNGQFKFILTSNMMLNLWPELRKYCQTIIDEMPNPENEIQNTLQQTNKKRNSLFSVLEWATIFYYAKETKLLPDSSFIKTQMEQFMNKHKVDTSFDNFKTKYYSAVDRINKKNDYPIKKLENIIPYLKENYNQTVSKVINDITFLKENTSDY